jgi:hypothetical protein
MATTAEFIGVYIAAIIITTAAITLIATTATITIIVACITAITAIGETQLVVAVSTSSPQGRGRSTAAAFSLRGLRELVGERHRLPLGDELLLLAVS